MFTPQLQFTEEVAQALRDRAPIVALESTLITHGFAYPRNLEIAREIEASVRAGGAVPATIAILSGRLTVGLTPDQLEMLGQVTGVRKCSLRDLGIAVGLREHGATTVAATMLVAERAGIPVFATGGIGGVHRGHPFDISNDLEALAQFSVTVVCAGAKALLDLPLTFERLETLGVPVIGFGSDNVPAFYSRDSGIKADVNAPTPEAIAQIVAARRALQLPGGELVCAPVPAAFELPQHVAEKAIVEAQRQADQAGVHGAASTPYLLAKIAELTDGASVRANMALLKNNAIVGAQVAKALNLA
jgi:pseudouridine-5'-phosphate glycosidase